MHAQNGFQDLTAVNFADENDKLLQSARWDAIKKTGLRDVISTISDCVMDTLWSNDSKVLENLITDYWSRLKGNSLFK